MDESTRHAREKMNSRVDLPAVVKGIEDGTFVPAISDAELDAEINHEEPEWDSAEAKSPKGVARKEHVRALYAAMKPERNAYVAIFLPEIWKSFENARDQLPVSQRQWIQDSPNALFRMDEATRELFQGKAKEWMKDMNQMAKDKASVDPETQKRITMYERYKKLVEFGDRKGYLRDGDAAQFINNGIETATNTAFSVAKMLLVVAEKTGTLQKEAYVKSLAHALRTIPVQFAMLDQQIAVPILDAIADGDTGFKTQYFNFSEKDGLISVEINWSEVAKIKHAYGKDKGASVMKSDIKNPATGCPAAVARSEHNVNVLRDHILWMYKLIGDNFDSIAASHALPKV